MGTCYREALIRFLFDENLPLDLVAVAHGLGYEATHVNFLGLLGKSDRALLPQIVGGDFTFVTNDRKDFLRLYKYVDVHAGLLIIIPAGKAEVQIELFCIAVEAIRQRGDDATNELIEVDGDRCVTFSTYPFDRANDP